MKLNYICLIKWHWTNIAYFLFLLHTGGCGTSSPPGTNDSDTDNPFSVANETDSSNSTPPNIIIFFSDDQGYADLGVQNIRSDIHTPHIDSLAQNGIRMTNGYVTAPQCVPSRAAMMTGVYQQRFGVDSNRYGPLPLSVSTIGEHFKNLGYTTGQIGKWDLDVTMNSVEWYSEMFPDQILSPDTLKEIPTEILQAYYPNQRGFSDTYFGYLNNYWTTFDLAGQTTESQWTVNRDYRVDVVNDSAITFIERNYASPFFLFVAHYAPHVPLDATEEKLAQFSEDLPERRRYALAAMASVDDGVGAVLAELRARSIHDNTLIFFISDNGAPLSIYASDTPINDSENHWNGSMNEPLIGEKGMLTDGGIRVPYIVQWPNTIPAGETIDEPVSALDAIYTALKIAGASESVLAQLDGTDILPALQQGESEYLNSRPLFWRFWRQSAVRLGNWKYISVGPDNEYLFDMNLPELARNNQFDTQPEKAEELKSLLTDWNADLQRTKDTSPLSNIENNWYLFHVHENELQ